MPDSPADRWRQPRRLDDLTLYRLARLNAVTGSMVVRLCEGRHGITRREWRLLAALADAGPLASSHLAERASLDRARTSRAVGLLVDKRLVCRQAAGRGTVLQLTEAGRQMHAALLPDVARINSGLLEALSDAEVEQFEALLQRLLDRATQQQQQAPQADVPRTARGGRPRRSG
jgi:DNA-binding MarR family transcriptional regulator